MAASRGAYRPPFLGHRNPVRSAYFRYQTLDRLSDLLTTRSNVYAVWITVGYFEVTAIPGGVNAGHPDGYLLGVELGSDTRVLLKRIIE